MDEKLTWKHHINHVNIKLAKGIGILYRLRNFVSKEQLRTLYFSFVQPYIDYGLVNWCSAPAHHLKVVKKRIDKAINVISFTKNTQLSCKKLNILDFENYVKYINGTFLWKICNGTCPLSFSSEFKRIYRTNRKGALQLQLPMIKTDYKKRFITYSGVKIWNEIPYQIREINILHKFKTKLRSHLLHIDP